MMSNTPEQIEQQTEPRHTARLAIYSCANDEQNIMTNYSININSGGVFIETVKILPADTLLLVKFKLPDTDHVITCNARVAWTNEPDGLSKQNLPPGMGLQFLDLSLENLHAIRNFLNNGDLNPTW